MKSPVAKHDGAGPVALLASEKEPSPVANAREPVSPAPNNPNGGERAHSRRAGNADHKNNLYETHPVATRALMAVEDLPTAIWEPACGPGAIVRVLRAAGHVVYATDLVDYKSRDQDEHGWDFLMEKQTPLGVDTIITNPPFKLATEFVHHALALAPRAMMLLRLSFYEGGNGHKAIHRQRREILDGGKLARIHVFRNRLPMMHRAGWQGPRASSNVVFAWFVWDEAHRGPTIIDRISWEKGEEE